MITDGRTLYIMICMQLVSDKSFHYLFPIEVSTSYIHLIYINAGYYLNPRLMYADNAHVDNEVLQGTLNVIGRLSMTVEKRLEVELQVDLHSFYEFYQ